MGAMNTNRKTPSPEGLSKGRCEATEEGIGSHGLGRSGGLGFAGWRPGKRGAQALAVDSGKSLKGDGMLSGHKALALPVIHGLLGNPQ